MSEQLRAVPWYDRNPLSIQLEYEPHLFTPHGEIPRATYKVPKKRNAFIVALDVGAERKTAADTGEIWWICIAINGGVLIRAFSNDNTPGARVHKSLAGAGILLSEEIITLNTRDVSDGGTVFYAGGWYLIEFDAFPIEVPPFQIELPKVDLQEPTVKNIVDRVVEEIKKMMG